MNYDKLVRNLRNSPKLFSEDDTISDKMDRILAKAKDKMMKSRRNQERKNRYKNVGPYSGLTKKELAMTGTCEPDWY